MPTSPEYFMLRSSGIKEMASFGADVSKLVPAVVAEQLKKRIKVIGNE
jgi:pantetheine-phosphate adenylyltransferase